MVFISPRIRELQATRPTPARTTYKLNPYAIKNRAADESKLEPKPGASNINSKPVLYTVTIELAASQTAQVELQHPRPFRHMALREAINRFEEIAQSNDVVPGNWDETSPECLESSLGEFETRPLAHAGMKPLHVDHDPVTEDAMQLSRAIAELDRKFPDIRKECKARAFGIRLPSPPARSMNHVRPPSPFLNLAAIARSGNNNEERRNVIQQDNDCCKDYSGDFDQTGGNSCWFEEEDGSPVHDWITNQSFLTGVNMSSDHHEAFSAGDTNGEWYFGEGELNSFGSGSPCGSPFIPPRPSPSPPTSSTLPNGMDPDASSTSFDFGLRSPRPEGNINNMALMWSDWMRMVDEAVVDRIAM